MMTLKICNKTFYDCRKEATHEQINKVIDVEFSM